MSNGIGSRKKASVVKDRGLPRNFEPDFSIKIQPKKV